MKYVLLIVYLAHLASANESDENALEIALSDLIINGERNITKSTESIENQLQNLDWQSADKALKIHCWKLVDNVQDYIKTVSKGAKSKSPEFQTIWSDVKIELAEVIHDIYMKLMTTKQSIEQFQKQFFDAVQSLLRASNTIAGSAQKNSSEVDEELAAYSKAALEITVQVSHSLSELLRSISNNISNNRK